MAPTNPPPAAQTANAAPSHPAPAPPATPVATAPDRFSPTATANAETVEDLPPNAIPVANNDTATVDEDGSVVIDVLVNDTDADGDPLQIDSWNWQPAHGTVTQTDDGKLEYTPDADFNGTDTFTYAATDGQDVSNTATVTVTVNPVNDPPVAFNDLYLFANPVSHGGWDPAWGPYTYMPTGPTRVLANDFDLEDGSPGGVAYTDFTGTVGTVTVHPDGSFSWAGPYDFIGETSFQYQAVDSAGGLSGWVTVKLRAFDPNQPPLSMTANADSFAVGEDPTTFNVVANDSGGAYAVLTTPPGAGVTGFDFDGTAHYAPRADGVPIGGQLSYAIFAPSGPGSAAATADMNAVSLQIFNGQDGAVVPDKNRQTVGAFTVVNKNDTDGDATVDNVDTAGVHAADGVGANEMDLMRLRVNKPAGFGANDTLTVAVTSGAAQFFATSMRETNLGQTLALNNASFTVNGQPVSSVDYWVEIYDTANTLRNIEIKMTYQGQTETVKATGIWVNFDNATGFHTAGNSAAADADEQHYRDYFTVNANSVNAQGQPVVTDFTLGKSPMYTTVAALGADGIPTAYRVYTRNAMEMEFTVTPGGVEREPGIRFDVSRTIEAKVWDQTVGGQLGPVNDEARVFPDWRERANDDGNAGDEDDIPKNGHIYSLDFPGRPFTHSAADQAAGRLNYSAPADKTYLRAVQRLNAQEFVRVKLDGSTFDHDPTKPPTATTLAGANALSYQGSRASELVDWHSWLDITWDAANSKWVRTADAPGQRLSNDIGLGLWSDLSSPGGL